MNEINKEKIDVTQEIKERQVSELFQPTGFLKNAADEVYDFLLGIREKFEREQFLKKILRWKESEFNFEEFDFEDTQLEKLLEKYTQENWRKLGIEEREALAKETCAYLAEKMAIKRRPKVVFDYKPLDVRGDNDLEKRVIGINSWHILRDNTSLSVLAAAAHEMRHVYQWERAKLSETELDELYKLNFENRIQLKVVKGRFLNAREYTGQLIEAEARAFAKQLVEKVREKEQ